MEAGRKGETMKSWMVAVLLTLATGSVAGLARADGAMAGRVDPDTLAWRSPPGLPLSAAWVVGREPEPGLYLLRVRLGAGGRIPRHTHPDTRVSTVLSGTLRVGFGEGVADDAMVVVGPGESIVVPAGQPHVVWAKDGAVEYQEAGAGPSATTFAAH